MQVSPSATSQMPLPQSAALVLKQSFGQLAQSSPGSQPPSFHDLRSPRYQNCTTCHITVHGSNTSPLLLK